MPGLLVDLLSSLPCVLFLWLICFVLLFRTVGISEFSLDDALLSRWFLFSGCFARDDFGVTLILSLSLVDVKDEEREFDVDCEALEVAEFFFNFNCLSLGVIKFKDALFWRGIFET